MLIEYILVLTLQYSNGVSHTIHHEKSMKTCEVKGKRWVTNWKGQDISNNFLISPNPKAGYKCFKNVYTGDEIDY